jgi:hypothetical protein
MKPATYQFCRHLCRTEPGRAVPVPTELLWDCADMVRDNLRQRGRPTDEMIMNHPALPRPNLLVYGHWIYWQENP